TADPRPRRRPVLHRHHRTARRWLTEAACYDWAALYVGNVGLYDRHSRDDKTTARTLRAAPSR
ncbi:hypothetical protein PV726_47960, partial [Streptomyces europaeiscabiei]|nr:hypothetical protein [Streptomyces europaeiscabiei]